MATIINETTAAPSLGAQRMRHHRDRYKRGCRCITIEIRESEIDELIRYCFLAAGERGDKYAVRKAVHALLDRVFPAR